MFLPSSFKQQNLEQRQADVEYELRCLLNKPGGYRHTCSSGTRPGAWRHLGVGWVLTLQTGDRRTPGAGPEEESAGGCRLGHVTGGTRARAMAGEGTARPVWGCGLMWHQG